MRGGAAVQRVQRRGHLQAGETHKEAAHGEGAGPADALEGIAGAEAGERAEGHRACARRDRAR